MRLTHVLAVACALAVAPLHAQDSPSATAPTAMPGMQDPQAMLAAYEAAQAAAVRPGDEKLSCEELETEMGATLKDPVVQENVAAAGEAAERDMASIAKAKEAYDAQLPASVAAGAATSVSPGGQWAATAKAAGQAESKKGVAAERLQQRATLAQGVMEMMPQLARGERIAKLGAAKGCKWAAMLNPETDSQPQQ